MGRLKNALNIVGEVAVAMAENNQKVDELTNELMHRSYGVDADQARKMAKALIAHAEPIVWK